MGDFLSVLAGVGELRTRNGTKAWVSFKSLLSTSPSHVANESSV
jgi:hypothetical protein